MTGVGRVEEGGVVGRGPVGLGEPIEVEEGVAGVLVDGSGCIGVLLREGERGEACIEHTFGGLAKGEAELVGGEGDRGVQAGGHDELGEHGFDGGADHGGVGGDAGGLGATALGERFAAGGEEVGFAHAEDGAESDDEGEMVDETGAADLQGGNGEGPEEGTEAATGDAQGLEGFQEVVLGVQTGEGAESEVGETLGSTAGHVRM